MVAHVWNRHTAAGDMVGQYPPSENLFVYFISI